MQKYKIHITLIYLGVGYCWDAKLFNF